MRQYIVAAEKKVSEEDATEERIRSNNNRKRQREGPATCMMHYIELISLTSNFVFSHSRQ